MIISDNHKAVFMWVKNGVVTLILMISMLKSEEKTPPRALYMKKSLPVGARITASKMLGIATKAATKTSARAIITLKMDQRSTSRWSQKLISPSAITSSLLCCQSRYPC